MTSHSSCPGLHGLKGLLEGSLSEEEQSTLTAHIGICEDCRCKLDQLAGNGESWLAMANQLAYEPPAPEPALHHVMESFQAEVNPGEAPATELIEDEWPTNLLDPTDKPGYIGRIEHYEVIELVGRGGMGFVLKAFDESLHRIVAIKVMAPQLATSVSARQRFIREAQATAAVRDEHVINIHAVDEFKGLPYLVMEFIAGISLQERLNEHGPLEVREVLRIGRQMAAGLAAAHAQGLIHRDIKPANILLENGVERVKITDFGLARAADDASLTQSGVVAGTPHYMAPEQARGETLDHRADLFSLGSVLYAMCASHPPFRADGALAILKRVCDESPRPVHEVNAAIPVWLAKLIEKLQAKNPVDRYQSAREVAELMGQYLAHLQQPSVVSTPPTVSPPTRQTSLATTAKLNRSRLIMAGFVLLIVAALGATETTGLTNVSTYLATVMRIRTAEGILVVEVSDPAVKVSIEANGDEIAIAGAGSPEVKLRPGRYRWLATKDGRPIQTDWVSVTRGDTQVVKISGEPASRAESVNLVGQIRVFRGHTDHVWSVVFSSDGKRVLSGGWDKTLRLWDVETGKELACLPTASERLWSVAISPDGRHALSAEAGDTAVLLWDLENKKELGRFEGHAIAVSNVAPVLSVAFSPDGHQALSGGTDETVRLWDVATRQLVRTFAGHTGYVRAVAFSADGRRVVSGAGLWDKQFVARDTSVRLCDVETGQLLRSFNAHGSSVESVVISPDGRHVLSAGFDEKLTLWDVETGDELRRFEGHTAWVTSVAFSPDGRRALSGSGDQTVRLWDIESGQELYCFKGHTDVVQCVAYCPDGRRAISGAQHNDKTLRLWQLPP